MLIVVVAYQTMGRGKQKKPAEAGFL